jgi:hypothetical protein
VSDLRRLVDAREVVGRRPDVRQSIRLVSPDHRAEPLLTRALITIVREVDLVAVLGPERRVWPVACTVMGRLMRMGGG